MDKTAQDRGLINKLREKVNISGKLLESVNPEFARTMDSLRSTDEKIRNNASQLKDLVKSSKSLLNRRDYLSAATNMSAFHEKCRYISAELNRFIKTVDLKHYKFLLDQFDDEQKEQLFGYDPEKKLNLDENNIDDLGLVLDKQAGVSDWWFKSTDPLADLAGDVASSRSKAMKILEKKFSISFLKSLKNNSFAMYGKTEGFFRFLVGLFGKLALYLAKRNIDQYVDTAKLFIRKFEEFHKQFIVYYQQSIIPLKGQYDELVEAQRVANETASKKMEEDAAPKLQSQQNTKVEQKPQQEQNTPNNNLSNHIESTLNNLSKPDDDDENNIPIPLTQDQKKAASFFMKKIERIAEPKKLILEILKYSEALEDIHPNTSLKLLAIAEGIQEEIGDE
jgi:hypothetical protein